MMVGEQWIPTTLVLWAYTLANLLQGFCGIAAAVVLPHDSWLLRLIRWAAAALAVMSIASGVTAIKLTGVANLSADEVMWRLMPSMLGIRWCAATLTALGLMFLVTHRHGHRVTV